MGIKFRENSKMKISLEFKVANYYGGGKIRLKLYLIKHKSYILLLQLQKNIQNVSIVGDEKWKKRPFRFLEKE